MDETLINREREKTRLIENLLSLSVQLKSAAIAGVLEPIENLTLQRSQVLIQLQRLDDRILAQPMAFTTAQEREWVASLHTVQTLDEETRQALKTQESFLIKEVSYQKKFAQNFWGLSGMNPRGTKIEKEV